LQHIFPKLGVETRTAAAIAYLQGNSQPGGAHSSTDIATEIALIRSHKRWASDLSERDMLAELRSPSFSIWKARPRSLCELRYGEFRLPIASGN